MAEDLDFGRIRHLFDPGAISQRLVTVVGLGSGGSVACDHLTMNGVRRWHLYDPDVLSEENLVKHPRMRRDLGRLKVDAQRDWIVDRNPTAEVQAVGSDVVSSSQFDESVRASDLVLCCPDKKSVREFVSDTCVRLRVPFVTASVFRTGIGGEVFAYRPGVTGCYRCLQLYAIMNNIDLGEEALGLTSEEAERIYGVDRDFRASGLSIDIQSIALIQARMALGILLDGIEVRFRPLKGNWVIFANRPAKGIFREHFQVSKVLLRAQAACGCGGASVDQENA